MKVTPVTALRIVVVALGCVAGPLLVRALDPGLAGTARTIGFGHVASGLLLAVAVMPGPLLGLFVTPRSSEKARGLAVGGSAVTALAAAFAGAVLFRRMSGGDSTGPTEVISLGWCVLSLPLAALDFLRLRRGAGDSAPKE